MRSACRLCAPVLSVWLVYTLTCVAADTPPAQQPPGHHATIATSDEPNGHIRDDELADYVAAAIPRDPDTNQPLVKDVKIFTQTCYGGGLLDDFGRVFGPGGVCAGVPWVGGSASDATEVSWGPEAGPDCWTGALGDAMNNANDRIVDTLGTAKANDRATTLEGVGKNSKGEQNTPETPQVASGNGGDSIVWHSPGTKHRAVLFGGENETRHDRDIDNVWNRLTNLWSSAPPPLNENLILSSSGGGSTRQSLFDMIDEACEGLDADTQLVLYFTNHGDSEIDVIEAEPAREIIQPGTTSIPVDVPGGWITGMDITDSMPGQSAEPTLNIATAAGSPLLDTEWDISFNGAPVELGGDLGGGQARQLALDWTLFNPGVNTLQFTSTGAVVPLTLAHLELSTGAITQGTPVPEPASLSVLLLAAGGFCLRAFVWRWRRRPA